MCVKKRENDMCKKNRGEKVKEGNFHTPVSNANEGIGFSKKGECCSGVTDKIKYKLKNININHRE